MDSTTKESPEQNTKGAIAMTLEKVKVYELAKELGMDSITLIDKLKRLNVDVKSHMSGLATEEVTLIREQIAKEQAVLKKVTKTTRKKAADPEAAAPKKAGATVIRRRAKSSDDAAEAGHTEAAQEEAAVEAAAPEAETQQQTLTDEVMESAATAEAEVDADQAAVVAAAPAAPAAGTPVAAAPAAPTAPVKVAPPAPLKTSGLKQVSLLGSRSEGLIPSRTSSILNIVKEEPRRVAPAPRVVPNVRPNVPGQPPVAMVRSTTGITTLGKDAIDRLVEEEQSFKKKGGAGGRTERDKEPVVNVSDYRAKKELIFLPKKKKVPVNKEIRRTTITTPAAHKRVIRIENSISVAALADAMGIKANAIIKKLIAQGLMATLHHNLDLDTATLIAHEYKYEVENVAFTEDEVIKKVEDTADELKSRPPIVTVMGHVDHGKTSLLDAIRSANVASGEAGGITQHIGAYTVDLDGKKITFIDTPGHEAFTVMRARGANVTDIVILVVAADDGVMPQTREAVDHAKAAKVPIIVAVNKIDKPNAAPEKVMKGLSELGLLSEAWGGENIFVNVSATKGTGVKELLESILLQAEVLDLKANPDRLAEGNVLEARLDRSRGAVVDILVKKGTLRVGDSIVVGTQCGRVRALTDNKGKPLKEVLPGYAAEMIGIEGVPMAGDEFNVMKTDAEARELSEHRTLKARGADTNKTKISLEELFSKVSRGDLKELPVILKTDVHGSTEAIRDSLAKIGTDKVKVKILSASTGGVSESDVMLASASSAIILAFNVRPEAKARTVADAEKIEIKTYSIIYELLDDVKKAMAGLLDKKAVEKYSGRAEVRELFSVPKLGTIAGSSVSDGKITRGSQVRVLRNSRVIYTGKITSLKRFKDDAKEVVAGYECGIGVENFNDLKAGDIFEAYTIDMIAQELGEPSAPPAAKGSTPAPAAAAPELPVAKK